MSRNDHLCSLLTMICRMAFSNTNVVSFLRKKNYDLTSHCVGMLLKYVLEGFHKTKKGQSFIEEIRPK